MPGEADDSCALSTKDIPRSIIFTSDTDLLLFEYHPETLVVLFQDAESPVGLKAYSPCQIAQKLQLKSLISFAFAISQRSSEGQDDLVRDARNINVESPLYVDFSRRYTAVVVAPPYLGIHSGLPLPMQGLDVRLSEFVHQALLESLNHSVYLPLLVEDPNQASAWNIAQDIRTIAYSLLATPASNVRELRRKAQGFSPQEISTYSATSIRVPAKELEGQVAASMRWAESKEISAPLLWALFTSSLILVELNTPPALPLMMRVLNGDFDNTWAFMHLTARLHAAMYSLRMLKQTIDVWLAINQHLESELRDTLSSLHKQMSSLPSISVAFNVPGQSKRVMAEHEVLRELVEEIYTSAGVDVPNEHISNKKKKRQAREAERKKRKTEQRQQSKPSASNAFALLDGT